MHNPVYRYRATVALALALLWVVGLIELGLLRRTVGDRHDVAVAALTVAILLVLTAANLIASGVVIVGFRRLMLPTAHTPSA